MEKEIPKVKRNAEKRKAKSRDAARHRRGKEADVFSELSSLIPVCPETISTMDKASIMRVAISHLKLRTLMGEMSDKFLKENNAKEDGQLEKALTGFISVVDKEGEFVYVSENVVKHIGLHQLDLIGQSMLEYAHPCDHEEIEEFFADKHGTDKGDDNENVPPTKTFFARLKSTLTYKGKNVNLKSATYRVIRFRGHRLVNDVLDCWLLIGESIPHPTQVDEPIDSSAIVTQHSLDMKFTYSDDRMEEELGFTGEELEDKSLCEFHHALDGEYMDKIYKDLYSKGQVWTDQYRFLVKNGGYRWMETQATVIHNTKTEKPQYIVCVHHVLSGVEEVGNILSTVQVASKAHSSTHKKKAAGECRPAKHGPILSTESIFVPRTKEMDIGVCAPKQKLKEEMDLEMGLIAPTAGDEVIPLFGSQEGDMVSLLQDVLLHSSEMDSTSKKHPPFSLDTDDDTQSSQPAGKPSYETPNLEQLVDQLPRPNPHFEMTSKMLDAEDVDLDYRAPFIPMTGEDAVLFQIRTPVPLTDEEETGPIHMLGTTESVFNPLPEDPNDVNKKMPIPISILRQEAMQKKEKQYREMEHKKVTLKLRHPVETNRLETGPPAKKPCLAGQDEPEHVYSPLTVESTPRPSMDNIKGSSVLKNLLLTGHDESSGYDIIKYNKHQKPSDLTSATSTLRGLLTGPMTYTPPTTPPAGSRSGPSSSSSASPSFHAALSPNQPENLSSRPQLTPLAPPPPALKVLQPDQFLAQPGSSLNLRERLLVASGDQNEAAANSLMNREKSQQGELRQRAEEGNINLGSEASTWQLPDDMLMMLFNICQKQASGAGPVQ